MSDGEKPLFYGGLPPRAATAVLDAPAAETAVPIEQDQRPSWNILAIASFVGSFFVSLVGIIGGYIALRQIKRTGQRGRYLAIAGMLVGSVALAITLAMLAILVIGGPRVVATILGLQEHPHVATTASPLKLSPAEAAAAKAAIASGGGAIPGHVVSGELCAAVKNFQTASDGAQTLSTSIAPEVLTAMERLAAVASPYQSTYQGYVAMAKDPASVPDIDKAQKLAAAFAKAVQVDVTTCM